jgi:acetate---CoA ligase (ADP-forming)
MAVDADAGVAVGGLETLLRPSSVAVIGASEDPFTYSGASVANLIRTGYAGRVYPINPKRDTVQGLPAYRSVLDVDGRIDTAIVCVPTGAVLPVLNECLEKGIRTATIVSSGFGEDAAGPAGAERAEALASLIAGSGLRVLGPNTAGLANLLDGYVPRAANNQLDPEHVRSGGLALLTQSGALGNTVFNRAQANGVGIGLTVATGGQMDVDVWELGRFALHDPRISAAMLIVETVDAASLEQLAVRARALRKVVVLLKLGRSDAGRAAVMTHSGSLAGDAAVQSAALRQLGVVQVDELDDLWQIASLVDAWGPPERDVDRLGVVALSGGEGALIADFLDEHGIGLAPTTAEFGALIAENFEYATAANPFDPSGEVIGRPEKVKLALRGFIERNAFSEVLVASPVLRPEIAERQYADLAEIVAEPRPRICLSYWAAGDLTSRQDELLRATGLPVFTSSRAAVRAIAGYGRAGRRTGPLELGEEPGGEGDLAADARYFAVRAELEAAGVEFPSATLVHSREEAVEAFARIEPPVVLKANVPSSTHKFANGLIALGIATAGQLEARFDPIAEAGTRFDADGIVVEAVAAGHLEVMLGAHRDPEFGDVIVVGSGGSMVEYLEDSALALSRYLTPDEPLELVHSTRIGRYLDSQSPVVAGRLAEIVGLAALWFARNRQVSGLDLNPLVVDLAAERVVCVDARVA